MTPFRSTTFRRLAAGAAALALPLTAVDSSSAQTHAAQTHAAQALSAQALSAQAHSAQVQARAAWQPATQQCTINDPRLDEISGMSRSTYSRPLRWVHNDSGDTARFFAISKGCHVRAQIKVALPKPTDWEDMAAGPNHTLWFGDIGDNGETRSSISVVRVKEPRVIRNRTVKATVFRLAYPDGAHNAEALMVRPRSGRVYVATKSKTSGAVYRAPKVLSPTGINVMTKVLSGTPRGLSSADWRRDGKGFFLGGYTSIWVFDSFSSAPQVVPFAAPVDFNEAAAWTRTGRAVSLTGEGTPKPVWLLRSN